MMKYLAVDGYLNGTGINDRADGGYIEHDELGLSLIHIWLSTIKTSCV